MKFELPKIETYIKDGNIIQDELDVYSGKIARMTLDLKDQQIRQKLIELGWTPPDISAVWIASIDGEK